MGGRTDVKRQRQHQQLLAAANLGDGTGCFGDLEKNENKCNHSLQYGVHLRCAAVPPAYLCILTHAYLDTYIYRYPLHTLSRLA